MRKADSLRRWLTAFLPDLRKQADRLQVYLEGGRISARRSATLSFAYAYTVKALITDFQAIPTRSWWRRSHGSRRSSPSCSRPRTTRPSSSRPNCSTATPMTSSCRSS
jgi:hypothetical protein